MKLEKLANGIYVSPMQFNIAPETIPFQKYDLGIHNSEREGDIASRILEQSSKFGQFVAVSNMWLAEQYNQVLEKMDKDFYRFKSPFAEALNSINGSQIFESTLRKAGNEGTLIARAEPNPHENLEVYFITPTTLGYALLKK